MGREALVKCLKENKPDIQGKKLYIWGTGNTAVLYNKEMKRLEEEDFFYISGYCDNNREKWGKVFYGKPIISPQKLTEADNVCVLICSLQRRVCREIKEQLAGLGIEGYLLDEVILKYHLHEVMYVYDSLCDVRSKEVYEEIIRCRLCSKLPDKEICESNIYFAVEPFRMHNEKEIFVDCGAYVGDTVEQYLWTRLGSFGKIIAFEADGSNYAAMAYRIERLKKEWNIKYDEIQTHLLGVGRGNEELKIQNNSKLHGAASTIIGDEENTESTTSINVVSLDEYLKEPYSFLKADIEGYEYEMLLGAEKGIRKYRPMLAISIYHNAVNLYSILPLIKSYVPEYQFSVRHHTCGLADTVLYAWVEDKE